MRRGSLRCLSTTLLPPLHTFCRSCMSVWVKFQGLPLKWRFSARLRNGSASGRCAAGAFHAMTASCWPVSKRGWRWGSVHWSHTLPIPSTTASHAVLVATAQAQAGRRERW